MTPKAPSSAASAPRHIPDVNLSSSADTARDSITVAAWTVISRVTGVARIAAIGAVLGPTFFGNTFQFANSLPNLVYYGFLAGAMFSTLLVPALVRHIDSGDRPASERVAGGFLGITLVGMALIAPLAVALAPAVLRLAAQGTADPAVGVAQEHLGRLFVIMFIPQIFFYGVIGTASAVMHSQRRFALAAAAPALENVGMISVLVAAALIFGTGSSLDPPTDEVLLLGLGTTAAVGLHALAQWWGAKRTGVVLRPRAGWRDPEVRDILRRALPALGHASLASLQVLAVLLIANRVPGGVVAFQIGLNFYFMTVAIGATPVSLSLLPRLARLHDNGDDWLFRDTLVRGLALGFFVTVPAATGLFILSEPLATAVSFGQMGSPVGVQLVATAIMALALAVVAHTAFEIGMYASYARKDARAPLHSMLVQTGTCLALLTGALLLRGTAIVLAAGLAYSISIVVGAYHLNARLSHQLPRTAERLGRSLSRIAVGAVVMAAPAWTVSTFVHQSIDGQLGAWVGLLAGAVAGCAALLAVHQLWRSPELSWVAGGFGHLVRRGCDRIVARADR